jgi:hypothetical protein
LERLKPVFKENPEDYEWLQNIAVEIERKLTKFDTSTFSKGIVILIFCLRIFTLIMIRLLYSILILWDMAGSLMI